LAARDSIMGMKRRDFLQVLGATAAAAALGQQPVVGNGVKRVEDTRYQGLRGFNYQPSYGSCGLELWQKFDAMTIDRELAQGRKYFPAMGAIRFWLSWDAYIRDPKVFAAKFESALQCADRHGLKVMPVLFNRWHDYVLDYGGIYIDQLLLTAEKRRALFRPYLESVVGGHAGDGRIFAWDMCNEPVLEGNPAGWTPAMREAEFTWLNEVQAACKEMGAKAPLCIGTGGLKDIERVEPICDILTIHPYFIHVLQDKAGQPNSDIEFDPPEKLRQDLEMLDGVVEFANRKKKPLLASETCWGAFDDETRVHIVETTLRELQRRGIGWLAYLLHHSLIADAHRPQYGPMDHAGYMAFIEADGSLRGGHDVFNLF
jgi:hypothetical protein